MNLIKIDEPLIKGQFYCYINYHPLTLRPIYVGKGKGERYRAKHHKKNKRWNEFFKNYNKEDVPTTVYPLNSQKEAFKWEAELIHLLRDDEGHDLYNLTDGGEGGSHIAETCLKISKVQKERSPERIKELVDKRLKAMASRPQYIKDLENEKRSKRLKETYKNTDPVKLYERVIKTNETKRNRPIEIIEDQKRRTAESNKKTHALIPQEIKQNQCTRGWATRRAKFAAETQE